MTSQVLSLIVGFALATVAIDACAQTVAGVTLTVPITRDPIQWPFSQTSIWNMPIGSGAVYVPAQLPADPRGAKWAGMPDIDGEIIVMQPMSPQAAVAKSSVGWTGGNRCIPDGPSTVIQWAPVPSDFVVPNGGTNNAAAFLTSDGRTVVQNQPFTVCVAGQTATALLAFPTVDLYGDGTSGAHGGSQLSALGGSIRFGELRPGSQPPRHALKVDVDSAYVLHTCAVITDCFRWPAVTADGNAVSAYGSMGSSTIPAGMKMGALLAIPPSVDLTQIGLETQPGEMLAWTLQNYGAYIVDTQGNGFSLNAENGPAGSVQTQFQADWGYPMAAYVGDNNPWLRDMQRLVVLLNVVDNNAPLTPGGGGTPLQPLAPVLTIPD